MQIRLIVVAVSTLAVAACATAPPPEEDPVLIKLTDLEARITPIERVMDNQSLVALNGRMDEIQAQLQQMLGDIESLQYELERANARQRDQYLLLDGRVNSLEATGAGLGATASRPPSSSGSGASAPAVAVAGASTASERDQYDRAWNLLKDGRYEQATTAFTGFLDQYPQSRLASNAQYWLGETHYVIQSFDAALTSFETVVRQYPASSKVPDALLKIGYCNYELGKYDEARGALERVTREYADTSAANLARQRLARLESEGR